MHPLLRKFLGLNWILFILMIALAAGGVFAIYSVTWFRDDPFWRNQIIWVAMGLPIFFALSLMDYKWIRIAAIPAYIVSVILLIAVRIFGAERFGSKSWIDLGAFNVQPSQFALLAGILIISLFLSRFPELPSMLRIAVCGALASVPCLLILLEPDLGSTLVWAPVLLGLFVAAGIKKRLIAVLLLLATIAIPLMVNFGLRPYQRSRIIAFLDPEVDPLGVSWTINQSLIAVGSGGLSGKGFKAPNTLNELGFLPSTIVHNDFIFSGFAEQFGFMGGLAIILVFASVILLALHIAGSARDELGKLLAVSFACLIFTHVFMNIGMTISVTPITGLPLPFISYGGTFAIVIMVSFGILQSIWIHRNTEKPNSF